MKIRFGNKRDYTLISELEKGQVFRLLSTGERDFSEAHLDEKTSYKNLVHDYTWRGVYMVIGFYDPAENSTRVQVWDFNNEEVLRMQPDLFVKTFRSQLNIFS